MKRETQRKKGTKMLTVWMPESLVGCLDRGVELDDSDRSKFVRSAIREKLTRRGIIVSSAEVGL